VSVGSQAVFDALQSHALASGLFERVNTHEPKNAPGRGLTAALWADNLAPETGGSGLASTNARIVFNLRIYTNMVSEPQDAIDPMMLAAVDTLLEKYSADFTLGGSIQAVDLLGKAGVPLSAQAGYINQDGQMMRTYTITLPVIINNAFTQTA